MLTRGRRTSFGRQIGWSFSSNGRQIGILFSFSQNATSICSRELQISFALQMLFSSGNLYIGNSSRGKKIIGNSSREYREHYLSRKSDIMTRKAHPNFPS